MATVVSTPNASDANSFLTVAEAQTYWSTRIFSDPWDNSDDQSAAVIMATRTLVSLLQPRRQFIPPTGGQDGYFIVYPTWTGAVSTTTQSLPWGRSGMYDANGNAIAENVIPQELKNATAELAGQMSVQDRLLDNDVAVQGITSVKAGSVAVTFRNEGNIQTFKAIPDAVLAMLVPSWLTEMTIEPMYLAEFDVIV